VKSASTLDKTESVVASLEALSSRLSDDERSTVEQARALLAELKELVTTLDGQLAAMRWLAQKQYRPKSDKVPEGQLALDLLGFLMSAKRGDTGDADPESDKPEETEHPSDEPLRRTQRKKRKSKLHLLPVTVERKEIPEAERVCPDCGQVKTEFDYEPCRHLVYVPARLYIREEHLVQYACRPCGNGVVIAQGTPKLIPGSPVSPSVLSHLTVSRIVDAMPLERTGKQWARHGAEIATQRLYDWNARAADEVAFTHPLARRELLSSALVSFDDTPLLAKVAGHPNGTQRGRLWLYLGDIDRIAYCEYTEDWKGCHPQKVLAGFRGPVQSDGYGGIAGLFRGHDPPAKVGCNDHSRRKFVDAVKLGDKRAAPIVSLFGELYAIEADAKSLSHDERLHVRQARSAPVWARLSEEVARHAPHVDAKSPLGKACTYFRRQHDALAAFLGNGMLPISNAHVERLLRAVALFRKNSLFVGSIEAGQRYAVQLTLAVNCTLAGANHFDYFNSLYGEVAAGWPASRAAELMPRAWLDAQKKPEQAQLDV
jgi:transposase